MNALIDRKLLFINLMKNRQRKRKFVHALHREFDILIHRQRVMILQINNGNADATCAMVNNPFDLVPQRINLTKCYAGNKKEKKNKRDIFVWFHVSLFVGRKRKEFVWKIQYQEDV